jgi:hypothetical protein
MRCRALLCFPPERSSHVIERGNDRQAVFFANTDCGRYRYRYRLSRGRGRAWLPFLHADDKLCPSAADAEARGNCVAYAAVALAAGPFASFAD